MSEKKGKTKCKGRGIGEGKEGSWIIDEWGRENVENGEKVRW